MARICEKGEKMNKIKNKDVISADLLSVEEAYEIPQWILANGDWWWLRSPGGDSTLAANVGIVGRVDVFGYFVCDIKFAVRPALKILNLPKLEIGDLVEVFGLKALYIGNDKVLLCDFIFNSQFDFKSNIYETSEVKKKLDEWFKREKGRSDG